MSDKILGPDIALSESPLRKIRTEGRGISWTKGQLGSLWRSLQGPTRNVRDPKRSLAQADGRCRFESLSDKIVLAYLVTNLFICRETHVCIADIKFNLKAAEAMVAYSNEIIGQ